MALPAASPGEKLQFCSCNTRSRLENLDLRHRAQSRKRERGGERGREGERGGGDEKGRQRGERESKGASTDTQAVDRSASSSRAAAEREIKKQVIATLGTRFCQPFRNLSGARGLWVA